MHSSIETLKKVAGQIIAKIRRSLEHLHQLEKGWENIPRVKRLKAGASDVHPFLGAHFWRFGEIIFLILSVLALLQGFFWKTPHGFPTHTLVTIESGEHLDTIASKFERGGFVSSSFWLEFFVRLRGGERNVIAGDYYFPEGRNIFEISKMITHGQYGLSPMRVVIFEGLNSMEIADVLAEHLPRFNKSAFIREASPYEGFLFPDTYFFMPNQSPETIVLQMRENFARKVNDLVPEMEKFGKSLDEIITMASIVEGEARQIETKRVVAGILWKRLRLDMPLQADATFKYWNGKHSFTLTKADLVDEDNPYNTYAHKGLPPTPVSNPGLDSIRAAIAPTNTEYLYFLTGHDGTMHYAIDFEGHKRNRELYLR